MRTDKAWQKAEKGVNGHRWSIEMRSLKELDSVWVSVLIRVVGVEGCSLYPQRRTRSHQVRSATFSLRAINYGMVSSYQHCWHVTRVSFRTGPSSHPLLMPLDPSHIESSAWIWQSTSRLANIFT